MSGNLLTAPKLKGRTAARGGASPSLASPVKKRPVPEVSKALEESQETPMDLTTGGTPPRKEASPVVAPGPSQYLSTIPSFNPPPSSRVNSPYALRIGSPQEICDFLYQRSASLGVVYCFTMLVEIRNDSGARAMTFNVPCGVSLKYEQATAETHIGDSLKTFSVSLIKHSDPILLGVNHGGKMQFCIPLNTLLVMTSRYAAVHGLKITSVNVNIIPEQWDICWARFQSIERLAVYPRKGAYALGPMGLL